MPNTQTTNNAAVAAELRANRREAGVTVREIDQAAYLYESTANLDRLSPRQLQDAVRMHYNAVDEAATRKRAGQAAAANIATFAQA